MYSRFTDRASRVMQLANNAAQRLGHEYISTGHILLGLIEEGTGVGINVLKNLGIDLAKVRAEVEKILQRETDVATHRPSPLIPEAKKAIEYAMEESRNLDHNYVGTEHLLLGLLREKDGAAAQVLINLGLRLEDARNEVLNVLGQGPAPDFASLIQSRLPTMRIRVAYLLKYGQPGQQVEVRGWVRTRRDSKQAFSFIELNDGSCMANLQVVVDAKVPGYEETIKQVTTGASIAVAGELKESPGQGQRIELHAASLELLGAADAAKFPLQKKGHSFEFLREIAHLRPRTNTFGAIARVRNAITASIHNFFQSRGFIYVQTPIITTSDCEGAGEMFQVTTLELARLANSQKPIDFSQDFFGKPASLTVSGQLEAEIFATSLGDCYTFGPTFRAENSNTARHLAEFWMIEPEMPFYDLNDNMRLAEEFIRTVIRDVLAKCPDDMEFFNQRIDKTVLETLGNIAGHDFIRLPYTEAIEILRGSSEPFEYPVEWGRDLQSEHERYLTEKHFRKPVILYDYPRTIKPFYMRVNDDGKTVRAMDVLVPRVGEIIGGSQREERLDVLVERMKECDLNPDDYWWYVDLRRYGTVPHSGFGLGLERIVQLITGMANIRDCIPFPRTPKNAEF